LRPLDENPLEWLERGVVAEERHEQLLGALRGQCCDLELTVVRLAAPAMPVFGAVVHEEQDASRREAPHQAVEDRLGFRIDPVEILEHQQQRLDPALSKQETSYRVQRALAALRRVQGLPL